MDRRIFIQSLLGVAGTAVAASAFTSKAQALPLLDELMAMDAAGSPVMDVAATDADLPAEGATEAQYYRRRYYAPRRRFYYRPRPMYRRCRTFVNRWGRLVRRCF